MIIFRVDEKEELNGRDLRYSEKPFPLDLTFAFLLETRSFGKSLVIMVEFWTMRDRILDSAEIWCGRYS